VAIKASLTTIPLLSLAQWHEMLRREMLQKLASACAFYGNIVLRSEEMWDRKICQLVGLLFYFS
jgi:hypothetical protein